MIETRLSELRIDGSRVSGILMPYGEISPEYRELFQAGAFGISAIGKLPINLQHDPRVIVGEGELTDGRDALRVSLDVPAGYRALVARGALTGFSVEFMATKETRSGEGVRVVEEAELRGAALVDRGAYIGARAEARASQPRSRKVWL